jgi:hypothetical protein
MTEVFSVTKLFNTRYANEKQLQRVVNEVRNVMAPFLFNSRS